MIDLMRSLISADVGMATATSVLWMVRHLLAKSVTAKSHLQRDLVLYFAAAICSSRAFIFEALFDAFRGDEIISSASVGAFLLLVVLLWTSSRSTAPKPGCLAHDDGASMGPVFWPSRTDHTRLVPTWHGFSYSYLLVGIPVGWKGSVGRLLSIDLDAHAPEHKGQQDVWPNRRKGWFSVEAEHYLNRGDVNEGLEGRLHSYLRSMGVNPLDYPHAYFVTAPRFLGYSFNPVSFWHLYDKDREFRAIILEVNNTFDERRMYFLPKSATDAESGLADVPLKLKASWSKDFHVSPFNSRDGSYSLIASDPLLPKMAGPAKIRNSVTLRSAEGPVTLVANIYSTHPAIDPAAMTRFSTLTFVADWWWVGFATFPRIVREAAKLFIKRSRGIRLILRPEVKALSLAREETADERTLEPFFRKYLQHQVQRLASPGIITYFTSLRYGLQSDSFSSPIASTGFSKDIQHVTFKIGTPAFFSRFVHYAHSSEAFDKEMLCAREENRTVSVTPANFLPLLLEESSDRPSSGALQTWQWHFMRRLRMAPPAPNYPQISPLESSAIVPTIKNDIRARPFSPLDIFVATTLPGDESRVYRRTVVRLFLAQRLAFGIPGLLDAYDVVICLVILWPTLLHSPMTGLMDGQLNMELAIPLATAGVLWLWACAKSFF